MTSAAVAWASEMTRPGVSHNAQAAPRVVPSPGVRSSPPARLVHSVLQLCVASAAGSCVRSNPWLNPLGGAPQEGPGVPGCRPALLHGEAPPAQLPTVRAEPLAWCPPGAGGPPVGGRGRELAV